MQGSGYGAIADIILGIAGALIGGFVMRTAGYSAQGSLVYTILVAILGAVLLTILVRAIKKA